jgi:hypothetical protein
LFNTADTEKGRDRGKTLGIRDEKGLKDEVRRRDARIVGA